MKIKIIFLLFLFSKVIIACKCTTPPISNQVFKKYEIIFYGKIDSVSRCTTEGIATAYFTISELYKGKVEKQVEVNFDCSSSCMMSFSKGEEWLIYATYQRFDVLLAKFCEHSRKCIINSKDYYLINSQKTFEEEREFLKTNLGIQSFIHKNDLNQEQKNLKGRNEQPSNLNKLWLLLVSLGIMIIIYYVSRNRKK